MRKLTSLMVELMLCLGARLTAMPKLFISVRLSTVDGLVNRGLIKPYQAFRINGRPHGGHAFTTAGLVWLVNHEDASYAIRRAAGRQLYIDADHAAALGDVATQTRIEVEIPRLSIPVGRPVRGAKLCNWYSAPGRVDGQVCTFKRGHDGNHSWAPDDLAPSSAEVQRAALAADELHATKTTRPEFYGSHAFRPSRFTEPGEPFARCSFPDCDSSAESPNHRRDDDGMVETIWPDGDAVRPAAPGECTFYGLISRSPCTLRAGHNGRHLLEKDVARAAAELTLRPAAEVERPHIADATGADYLADPYTEYGADERWTYLGPGGLFRVGPEAQPVVHAVALPKHPGRFSLIMLGHMVADVERAPDGMWREVGA